MCSCAPIHTVTKVKLAVAKVELDFTCSIRRHKLYSLTPRTHLTSRPCYCYRGRNDNCRRTGSSVASLLDWLPRLRMGKAACSGLRYPFLCLGSCAEARACSRACCLARAWLSPWPRSIMGSDSEPTPGARPVAGIWSGASSAVSGEEAERVSEPRPPVRSRKLPLPNPWYSARQRISLAASDASLVAGRGGRPR